MITEVKKEYGVILVWPSPQGVCQQVGGTRLVHSGKSFSEVVAFHRTQNGETLSVQTVFGSDQVPSVATVTYQV